MKNSYGYKHYQGQWLVFSRGYVLDLSVTAYAKHLSRMSATNTVVAYLTQIIRWMNFLYRESPQNDAWRLEPQLLRKKIFIFLSDEYQCQLRFARFHEDAMIVTERGAIDGRSKLFLAAMQSFYRILFNLKLYAHRSPLRIPSDEVDEETQEQLSKPQMPLVSGCELPAHSLPYRLSNNYFVCAKSEWIPRALDCADFPRLMQRGGKIIGWSLRERIIFRMLFETGARISEVLGLTLADWRMHGCANKSAAFSKGSSSARVKYVSWSQDTTKLLREYFDTDRRKFDSNHWTLNDYLDTYDAATLARTPLFLNRYGTAVTANSYRSQYWNPAATAAGIKANPHQARHWYVTAQMRKIFEDGATSNINDPRISHRISMLIAYMKWKRGAETIQSYNHYFQQDIIAALQDSLHEKFNDNLATEKENLHTGLAISTVSKIQINLKNIFSLTEMK